MNRLKAEKRGAWNFKRECRVHMTDEKRRSLELEEALEFAPQLGWVQRMIRFLAEDGKNTPNQALVRVLLHLQGSVKIDEKTIRNN